MPEPPSPVVRAPMRSRDDAVPAGAGPAHALAAGVCGMGGRLAAAPDDLDEALAAVADAHGDRTAARLRRFAALPDGTFCFTREDGGATRLGRLTGPWRYDATAAAHAADLVHVRPCDWLPDPVPDAELPPGTRRTFARGGRNLQRTHADGIEAQALALWQRRC